MTPKYHRILLKLSGEALAGDQRFGLNEDVVSQVVDQLVKVHNMGVQIGLVIGGGNFWRGRQGTNMDRTTADHMGMLATVMNSLAMMDAIEQRGIPTRVQTALIMTSLAEPYILRKALHHFEKGRIVIMACGTGNPFCSTDTAAAQRACEIDADVLLMAKNVDGIYDSDPATNPNAKNTIIFLSATSSTRGSRQWTRRRRPCAWKTTSPFLHLRSTIRIPSCVPYAATSWVRSFPTNKKQGA